MRLVVLLCGLLATAEEGMHLQVRSNPRMLFAGRDVRIECRVPRIRAYERVTFGLEGPGFYTASTRELPGPVIYELLTQVPADACGEYRAFCEVEQGDRLGTVRAAPASVLVACAAGEER